MVLPQGPVPNNQIGTVEMEQIDGKWRIIIEQDDNMEDNIFTIEINDYNRIDVNRIIVEDVVMLRIEMFKTNGVQHVENVTISYDQGNEEGVGLPTITIFTKYIHTTFKIRTSLFLQLYNFFKRHENSNFFEDSMWLLDDEDPIPLNNDPHHVGGDRKRRLKRKPQKKMKTRRR